MAYKKGDEKIYFPTVMAALLAIAAIIGTILYQTLTTKELNYEEVFIEETGNMMGVNPGKLQPENPPSFVSPTTPPPSN